MNIIIINDFAFINGGAEKVAIQSAIELSKMRNEVYFFAAVGPVCSELKNSKVNVICLDNNDILKDKNRLRAGVNGLWNANAARRFKVEFNKFDRSNSIVHIHSWQKSLTSSVIWSAYKLGLKIVMTLHNYSIACPNGGFYNYKTNSVCKKDPISIGCLCTNCDSRKYIHKIWRSIRQIIESKIIRLNSIIKHYIYISNNSRNVLCKYIDDDSNYYYVSNPISLERESRYQVESGKCYAYVGRLSKEKGVATFAKAIKLSNVEGIIIGDGVLRQEIINENPNVKISGWVDEREISNLLKNVRALILPSLWYEGMPLVVLEALSRGIPVIVSNVCNATEIVKDEFNGLHFNVNDKIDLAHKIDKFKDDNYLKDISINAYNEFWKSPFVMKRHIAELKDAYEKIILR